MRGLLSTHYHFLIKKVPSLGVCPRYRQQGELLSLLRDIKGEGGELRKKVGGGCFVVLETCIHLLLVYASIQAPPKKQHKILAIREGDYKIVSGRGRENTS